MKYSESLINYLRKREGVGKFRIGQWLRDLTDGEIKDLIDLGESLGASRPIPDKHPDAADFFQLAIYAFAAEKGVRTLENVSEIVECLRVGVSLESLSRDGFIELHGTLSIDPDSKPPRLTMTDKGMAAGVYLKSLN